MKIALTSHSGGQDFDFTVPGPWNALKDQFETLGHNLVKLEGRPEVLIFNNFNAKLYRDFAQTLPPSRLVLVSWEPPINHAEMYEDHNLRKFGHKFFPSKIWAQNYGGHFFPWPQNYEVEYESLDEWQNRLSKICMLQSNKWSFVKGENYTLRRQIPQKLEKQIDLFGPNWNRGVVYDSLAIVQTAVRSGRSSRFKKQALTGIGYKYRNYRGYVNDKIDTLKKYRYSLVVENSNEYVSEKVFDVLRAGTVPIYIGGEFEDTGLDEKMVVRAQPNLSSIKECIRSVMSDQPYAISVRNRGYEVMRDRQRNGHTLEDEFRSLAQKISEALT